MPANGYSRLNPPKAKIPSIGKVMGQGNETLGAAGSVPDIGKVMKQGSQRNGDAKIPTIQRVLRQGGGSIDVPVLFAGDGRESTRAFPHRVRSA